MHLDLWINLLIFSVGSVSFLMGGLGVLYSSIFIGKTSRKRILQIALLWYAVGMVVIAISPNIGTICFGLIVTSSVICKHAGVNSLLIRT